jgi:hypothetical protein
MIRRKKEIYNKNNERKKKKDPSRLYTYLNERKTNKKGRREEKIQGCDIH